MDFDRIFSMTELILVISVILPFIIPVDASSFAWGIQLFLGIVLFFSIKSFFSRKPDTKGKWKNILYSIFLNYGLLSIIYVLLAYLFLGSGSIFFTGFLLLAIVPPAIAIVPLCYLSKCDPQIADSALFLSYLLSLIIIPSMLLLMFGRSIDFLTLAKLLLLLIVLPTILAYVVRHKDWKIFSHAKAISNLCIGAVIFIAVSVNKAILINITNPGVLKTYAVVIIAIFGLGFITYYISRRYFGMRESVNFALYASQKNEGTAIAIGLIMFSPEVAIPSIIALVLQFIFFVLFEKFLVKIHLKHLQHDDIQETD